MPDTTNQVAIVQQDDPLISALERAMYDPSFDTAKFEVLIKHVIALQERDAERDFNDAMASVQSELDVVTKDRPNPAMRSRYATLDALYREAMPVVSKYGVTVRFGSEPPPNPGSLRITCKLSKGRYSEVHYLEGPLLSGEGIRGGRTQMTPIQAVGATVTYLRRYLLMMVLNLVQAEDPTDNDGNGHTHEHTEDKRPTTQTPPATKPKDPDPIPGESMADYAKRVEAARGIKRDEPKTETKTEPNGNEERKRSRVWVHTVFAKRCQAVTDKDGAAALLRDEELQAAEARLKEKWPELWVEYDNVRQAMISRVWPPSEDTPTDGAAS